jgi:hypothetical protein
VHSLEAGNRPMVYILEKGGGEEEEEENTNLQRKY